MDLNKIYQKYSARCARQECCRQDLWQSMQRAGVPGTDAEKVLGRLEDEGFISAERYARAYALDKVRYDKWGRVKIRQALYLKRIDTAYIDTVLAEIPEQEYREILGDLLQKKQGQVKADTPYEERQKVARYAIGKGFEPHLVFEMLNLEDF